MAVGPEDHAGRLVQVPGAAGGDEHIDERTCRPVVSQHLTRVEATDVQVAVRSEGHPLRCVQASAADPDKLIDEHAGGPVVAVHIVL